MVSELLEDTLFSYSQKFISKLESIEGNTEIPTEDFGWDNFRYESYHYRLAHVERYTQDGLVVLHITCFPHHNCVLPIFGLDIVGNTKQNKVMAAFLDCSPTLLETDWQHSTWTQTHRVPDWGDIFSQDFIAIRPTEEEVERFCTLGYTVFCSHIHQLQQPTYYTKDATKINYIVDKQNTYCEKQSQNKRTFGVLKHKLGEERAKYFMKHILFPKISHLDTNC